MDVSQSVTAGRLISGLWDFLKGTAMADWFRAGGPMDYQRPDGYGAARFGDVKLQYRDVTNYLYGAVSSAAGYNKAQTLNNAGTYNRYFGGSSKNVTPYGIRLDAVRNISQGYRDSSQW
jgi:hypothetical protein